ncbi:MAG TPA: hypothetical protein VKA83_26285 [Methylomirabilota bacterium]|jgi:hypothetical protein|nr:hypothetical protein [Methylomirabilota bacterium]
MTNSRVKVHGYANRTPWSEASREVPAVWLEDEARNSPSPYSLLASWKGARGGVPSHVMIKMLRRRLRECQPGLPKTASPPPRLQRAQDMLAEIWARVGGAREKHPIWRLVEGLLRISLDRVTIGRTTPDHAGPEPVRAKHAR